MKIDWLDKLRHFLQATAFCLAIAGLHLAFKPNMSYDIPLVYSLSIGLTSWLIIDFGAQLFTSARESGWPQGIWGKLLPITGIGLGYAIGTSIADWWFGWSTWAGASRQQLFLSALISAVIGTIVTYYFYSRGKSEHLEKKVNEATRLATEARLKLLETQLEPHMLFNTLANLRVLIGTDPQRAQDMLDRVVAYLRATLSASRASNHALAREFDRLRDYLELMSVRMGPRMHYVLDLPPDLAEQSVPTLLLQPLVENSIKHGLEPKVEGGTITVRALRDGQRLTLQVSDTGVGFDDDTALADGFGLAQVRERLSAVYAERGSVEQTSTPGQGTTILLHLPLT
jgi:hypothetical protein